MKIVLFTDIHFGEHSNSDTHNEQCINFLNFVQEYCDEHLSEDYYTIFLGDWFHSRNAINVKTLNYGFEGLTILSNIGERQFLILGNHDLYYRDSRETYSVKIPESASEIEIIDSPIMLNNMLLCPWLIGEEKLKDLINKFNPKYIFGHFEIPSFPLNSVSKYPGEFNAMEYEGPLRILSGHFHKRSENRNITYIGNCFSHNFSDKNDWKNKGFAIFDTETNEIEYIEWKEAPKYIGIKVSEINKLPNLKNMYVQIYDDASLSKKDLINLESQLSENSEIIEYHIIPNDLEFNEQINETNIEYIDNVNEIIIELLSGLKINNIDNQKLVNIYKSL